MALFIKAAALFAVVTAASVAPSYDAQTALDPVQDRVAEAKAPDEDPVVVDAVQAVNAYVNSHIQGISDLEHYGAEDQWVEYPSDGKGDCEDFALTKMGMLGQIGVPLVTNTKIVSVLVRIGNEHDGHAILAIMLPHGTVLYLDNLHREVMTRRELVHEGYTFFDWKA